MWKVEPVRLVEWADERNQHLDCFSLNQANEVAISKDNRKMDKESLAESCEFKTGLATLTLKCLLNLGKVRGEL